MANTSVVLNYTNHTPTEPDGYVQLTRSGGRVYIVVDGTPVGNVPATEFAEATANLTA